ncbi:phosphotransferase-like protein [Mesorhizobium cantuariense]|uniref:Chloramphenicol phosphotransferase n=1 Tax=Mesorhizobium cantuariense TaxID=1300275 RepID=A0ABV7MXL3_9HYPH
MRGGAQPVAHQNIDYDLEVDTSVLTPLECARRIQQRFQL